jgi:hypothetical protein
LTAGKQKGTAGLKKHCSMMDPAAAFNSPEPNKHVLPLLKSTKAAS